MSNWKCLLRVFDADSFSNDGCVALPLIWMAFKIEWENVPIGHIPSATWLYLQTSDMEFFGFVVSIVKLGVNLKAWIQFKLKLYSFRLFWYMLRFWFLINFEILILSFHFSPTKTAHSSSNCWTINLFKQPLSIYMYTDKGISKLLKKKRYWKHS